jgi:hypothetical protein
MDTTTHEINMALYYAGDDPAKLKALVEELKDRIESGEFDSSEVVEKEKNAEIDEMEKDWGDDTLKHEAEVERLTNNRGLWMTRAEEAGYEAPETPFNVHNFKTEYGKRAWGINGHCATICHEIDGENWKDIRIDLTPEEGEEIKNRIVEICGDDEEIAKILAEYWEKIPKDRREEYDRTPKRKTRR